MDTKHRRGQLRQLVSDTRHASFEVGGTKSFRRHVARLRWIVNTSGIVALSACKNAFEGA